MVRKSMMVMAASAMVLAGSFAARAQSGGRTVWDGTYSAAQATRGKAVYAASCAMCHGEGLAGIDMAPPLMGSAFLNNWNGTSAGDLFTRIHDTMPLNNPGTLSGRNVADVEAFVLQANGFPAGEVDLPSNPAMLGGTKIVTTKP